MLRKSRSPSTGYVRVIFELPSSLWASCIYLVGDFNDWREDEICLYQNRSGVWTTSLDLLEGETYEFRYIIDGQWRTDFQADAVTDNIYASQNSIVIAKLPDVPAPLDTISLETGQAAGAAPDNLPYSGSTGTAAGARMIDG